MALNFRDHNTEHRRTQIYYLFVYRSTVSLSHLPREEIRAKQSWWCNLFCGSLVLFSFSTPLWFQPIWQRSVRWAANGFTSILHLLFSDCFHRTLELVSFSYSLYRWPCTGCMHCSVVWLALSGNAFISSFPADFFLIFLLFCFALLFFRMPKQPLSLVKSGRAQTHT